MGFGAARDFVDEVGEWLAGWVSSEPDVQGEYFPPSKVELVDGGGADWDDWVILTWTRNDGRYAHAQFQGLDIDYCEAKAGTDGSSCWADGLYGAEGLRRAWRWLLHPGTNEEAFDDIWGDE